MRTGSGDRKIRSYEGSQGFRSDSKRKPSTDSKRFRSKESGMGWDRGGDGLEAWSDRRSWEFEFVEKNLPGEVPGLCVSALLSLRLLGRRPTKAAILERLHDSDRTAEQLRAKGWLE